MKFSPSEGGGCFPEVFFPISPMVGGGGKERGWDVLWREEAEEEGILASRAEGHECALKFR